MNIVIVRDIEVYRFSQTFFFFEEGSRLYFWVFFIFLVCILDGFFIQEKRVERDWGLEYQNC